MSISNRLPLVKVNIPARPRKRYLLLLRGAHFFVIARSGSDEAIPLFPVPIPNFTITQFLNKPVTSAKRPPRGSLNKKSGRLVSLPPCNSGGFTPFYLFLPPQTCQAEQAEAHEKKRAGFRNSRYKILH